MIHYRSRIMIAAPASNSGKTAITCGLLTLLSSREWVCTAFKCGPDFIDPLFHQEVQGVSGGNLDSYFSTPKQIIEQLVGQSKEQGITLIEGVMGYYDGVAGISTTASSYEIAVITKTPVILVIDAKGSSLSIVALIKGFISYRQDHQIKGIILNRTSAMIAERLRPEIEALGVVLIGFLPQCQCASIESRHLGLVTPSEMSQLQTQLQELAATLTETLDLQCLYQIAREADPLVVEANENEQKDQDPIRIGIAKDRAFCFYYQENLKMLEQSGAVLVPFSPIDDQDLPDNLSGLLFGGGYPEIYAKELSENESMRQSVADHLATGMPVIAECGGFLYLHQQLEGIDGSDYPMVGMIKANAYRTKTRSRFGYIELTANHEQPWLAMNQSIRGHEFHYWESSNCGAALSAQKPLAAKRWDCMHICAQWMVGFPHLYYPSNPEIVKHWIQLCHDFQQPILDADV